MKIEFDEGEEGFEEALQLQAMAHSLERHAASGKCDAALVDFIEKTARVYMARPEFRELRRSESDELEKESLGQEIRSLWVSLVGPGSHEIKLGKQRAEALARAARAERASFEALAEMTEVARQRDDALARIRQLERELNELRDS